MSGRGRSSRGRGRSTGRGGSRGGGSGRGSRGVAVAADAEGILLAQAAARAENGRAARRRVHALCSDGDRCGGEGRQPDIKRRSWSKWGGVIQEMMGRVW